MDGLGTEVSEMAPAVQEAWPNATAIRCAGEFILLRRAASRDTDAALVLVAPADQAALKSLERLKHEYALRDRLDPAWAAKPISLTQDHGHGLLELTDPGGELLTGRLGRPWDIGIFLRVAIGMSAALGRLHAQGLIHKDIKPDHVLVDIESGAAWLTGFGIASRLARERQAPDLPEAIAGTLAYMAPEQTGRMNRSIDARSDLYALGVTFYQMLTGELPFVASDPMEFVHCHIARQPVPPIERTAAIPAPVSAIVLKLLAKTAEDRYQTVAGLAADLRRCLSQWERGRGVEEFALGRHDMSDRLRIPEKLYGREREVQSLLAAFEHVVQGGRPEVVLVSGYSGIGKSSVVNELQKALVPPRGLFASGKFDQYKRDIPYSTLAQALLSLVRGLLAKSDDALAPWRDALHAALGQNGRLITDLVPELALIIGEQPPVPELPLEAARGRFQLVFRRLVGVFARPEHPLALFLDDLQWLDTATLDLVEDLVTHPDVTHLMLIGAYRDNEVDSTHPLVRKLQAMRQAGALLRDVVLAPLGREDLEQLIGDSLHCDPALADPLTTLVQAKTNGNPFFAIQFLSALHEEDLLTFDHVGGRWSWDLARIDATGYTDNVVDLMVGKLTRLDAETQDALKQLACLGNSAEFATVHVVYQDSAEQMHARLAEAVEAGYVLHTNDSYHFLHDRVQEAAYSLIPQELRAEAHLRIGILMASNTPAGKLEEKIFEIVNQLNRGHHLLKSITERERVAELNLIAGRRAKNSTAYASAIKYLRAGRNLLDERAWRRSYDLVFAIEILLAECELLSADMAGAEIRLTMLAGRAKTSHDIALVTRPRLTLYTALGRSDRAVEVFLEFWRGRGMEWSAHPTEEEVRREYDRIWTLLGDRQIEELIDLALVTDRDVLDVLDVLTEIVTPAVFIDETFLTLVICRMIGLSLEHGNCDGSCYAYVWLGMLAGSRFGNYQAGLRLGRLGCDLAEKHGLKRYIARTYMSFGALIVHWVGHVKGQREHFRRGFDGANEIGDLTFAAYSCNALYTNLLAVGDPLKDVQHEAEAGLAFATRIRFGFITDCITAQLGLVRTLRGLTPTFGVFSDDRFDELDFERKLASDPALALPACWYWIRKLQARFLAGDYPCAIDASVNAGRLVWTSRAFFELAEYHFYSALAHAAALAGAEEESRERHLAALVAHQRMQETWAEHGPQNFENRKWLVGAEIARIEGRELDAERLYDAAIKSARENGFVHNEALANELAARFYLSRGLADIGTRYLRIARQGYLRWGAEGKVRQLDETYPGLREDAWAASALDTIKAPIEALDLATVIKVSQALSGEVVLERTLDALMRTAIEHAGAVRGLLILARPGEHRVVAEITVDGDKVAVQMRNQSVAAGSLPQSVYHYVLHTRESVILDDAAAHGAFTSDAYIRERRARSVLCMPLLKQATLIGVLYLENPLATGAFMPQRIAVLSLIASQAAIALENARLYAELQKAQRLEAMGTLAGGIAHDFNNILGAVLGYGEMALRGATAGTQLWRDLQAIMAAGERGRALVQRVLAFSRSGVAVRAAVHVEKIVREVLDLLKAQLSDAVRLDAELVAGRAAVLGDATQMHQVVMNLCTNAVQAMPDGGALTVSLRIERFGAPRAAAIGSVGAGEHLVLAVTDTGLGIATEMTEKIFEPFVTTKEVGSGTGLGLSLVQDIVTKLGGAIDVESTAGHGSTFTVYLPRSGDAAETDEYSRPPLPRGQGQRVLVVDDEVPLARLAVRILEDLGYVPVSATSGAAALAAIREDPTFFDAIITDERMPNLSGCDLAHQVRTQRSDIPILLMSGDVSGALKERAHAAGVVEVLTKPLSAHDLADGLARILPKSPKILTHDS
jgi:predicted ATPase/signal transduction histidine kinase/ActR/RegA family two-component response regulator